MKAGKIVLAIVLVLLVMGAGAGVIWYFSVPHSAAEQFAYADKLDKKMRGDVVSKGPKAMGGDIQKVIDEYLKVGAVYGKSAKAAEALKRVADVWENVARDDAKAMAALDQLIKDYPGLDNEGFALLEQARLLRKSGDDLKLGQPTEAAEKYKAALAKLEEYRKKFEKEATAKLDDALMETGRIWQDGLGEPLIKAIDIFEKQLKDYPASPNRAEALYRLGRQYLAAKDEKKAMDLYTKVEDEFPGTEWEAKARQEKADILAKDLDHKKAAEEYKKLAEEHPDSPEGQGAARSARSQEGQAGEEEGKKYSEGRYGGKIPYDTVRDKALPPTGMIPEFAAQKLDARKYDLDVEFLPADQRITVKGTLSLLNGGATKKELLLMLGGPLKVTALTVDGKPAKFTHSGETLTIELADELKNGGAATVGFEYTGQYAAPLPTEEDLKAAMGRGPRPAAPGGPATAPATSPATAPAPVKKELKYAYNPQMALGEFGYGLSGAAWYPITIIGDVFDAHILMRTPENIEAVSNGEVMRREKSTKAGVKGVFEFNTKEPVFGLYFAYGPYTVQETEKDGIHFYSYFRPENAGKHDAYVGVMDKILSFYASKFAAFPYEKMAVVEVPLPPFLGGVGPASLMFLHQNLIVHAGVPEYLLAHELAHQWFGNLIPINMMDVNYNQWLSEGFATYCDALYTEHLDGPKALAAHMQKYGQFFFQFDMLAGRGEGAIKTTFQDSPLYRPVIYEKGAIVLHMLRKVMGDDKFFSLMRDYVAKYRNKPTTVEDFERMASTVHGSDLSWFFSEWIDQTVFAHWKVAAEITGGEKPGEAAKVVMHITQPDDYVRMPVDISLIGAAGERQIVPNVLLDKKEQTVEATATFRPIKVIIDEDYWVLRHPGSDNIWSAAPRRAGPGEMTATTLNSKDTKGHEEKQ